MWTLLMLDLLPGMIYLRVAVLVVHHSPPSFYFILESLIHYYLYIYQFIYLQAATPLECHLKCVYFGKGRGWEIFFFRQYLGEGDGTLPKNSYKPFQGI